MKNLTYILVFVAGLFFLNACDSDDTEGAIYKGANNEASFSAASSAYTCSDEDPESFEVTLQRGIISGDASVPLTVSDSSGLFTVPATAEFADGAYETKIPITFSRSKLVMGKPYAIVISVPKHPISTKIISHTVTITRDYAWSPFATGTYTSWLFGEITDQALEKADGINRYRFPALYAKGYDLTFDVAEDGSITSIVAPQNASGTYAFTTGYIDPKYGMMYVAFDTSKAVFDLENKTFKMNAFYYVSAGSFDSPQDDIYTWK